MVVLCWLWMFSAGCLCLSCYFWLVGCFLCYLGWVLVVRWFDLQVECVGFVVAWLVCWILHVSFVLFVVFCCGCFSWLYFICFLGVLV